MVATASSLAALTTVFTPPGWCADRYAVFIDSGRPLDGTSTITPSSGWVDPKFPSCIPSQYTTNYPVFSPGVCPDRMSIVSSSSSVEGGKTIWTGACCESGFSTMELDPRFLCTSSVTTPMAFLLDPDISTADVYTTLSSLWIEHDQVTVQWEQSDLPRLPRSVAVQYASIMGVEAPTSTTEAAGSSSVPAQTVGTPASSSAIPTSESRSTRTTSSRGQPTIASTMASTQQPSSTAQSTSTSSGERVIFYGWLLGMVLVVTMGRLATGM